MNFERVRKALLPHTLTRIRYVARLLALFVYFGIILAAFVSGGIPGWLFLLSIVLGRIYAAVGLAAPRLRNAGYEPASAVFVLVFGLIASLVLIFLREQPDAIVGELSAPDR